MSNPLPASIPLIPYLLRQLFFLLPLLLMLAGLKLTIGGQIYPLLNQCRGDYKGWTEMISLFSSWANFSFYGIYGCVLLRALQKRDPDRVSLVAAYALVQGSVTVISVIFMKFFFGRPRPFTQQSEWRFFSVDPHFHSLPSGHTAEITAAATPFAQRARSVGVTMLWGLIPAAMGFARLYLGQHYPADVLVAALMGSLSGYLMLFLAVRIRGLTVNLAFFHPNTAKGHASPGR